MQFHLALQRLDYAAVQRGYPCTTRSYQHMADDNLERDRQCVQGMQHGDEAAFGSALRAYIELHRGRIYRFLMAKYGNMLDKGDIEELTMNGLFKAALKIRGGKYQDRGGGSLKWTTTLVIHHVRDEIRKRMRAQDAERKAFDEEHYLVLETRLDGMVVADRFITQILAAMPKLPPQQRQAVQLKLFERRSAGEVASTMGVDDRSVASFVTRGLQNMHEDLAEHGLGMTHVSDREARELIKHFIGRLSRGEDDQVDLGQEAIEERDDG